MSNPYRVIFDHHPHPMWVSDPDTGRSLAVNDAAGDHYGYTRDEFPDLIDDSPVGIYRRLPDGQLTMANSTMANMLGYTSFNELRAGNVEEARHSEPEEHARFRELMEREGEATGFQTTWRRGNGQQIDGSTVPILIADDDEEDRMLAKDALKVSRLVNPLRFVSSC